MNRNAAALAALALALVCVGVFVAVTVSGRDGRREASAGTAVDERKAVEIVGGLDECDYYAFVINTVLSAGGRVVTRVEDVPDWVERPEAGGRHFWFVAVGEEIGGFFEVWKHFAVDSDSGAVMVYDAVSGRWMNIKEWRLLRKE